MKRFFGSLAAVLTLALVAAACGGGGGSSNAKSATTTTSAATTTTAGAGTTVKTANSNLGTIVVNADGKTLYANSSEQGTTSACTGACASIWPALMAAGTPTGGAGIDASKLSKAPSGQVVYNGHLLYMFSSDTAAGDTKGQGVAGIWHVVAPTGDIIS